MILYAVRHGQTEWNVMKKMQGSVDIPLNENGLKQAHITKENLKDYNIDLVFCSPLSRARQTAEIINEDRNLEIVIDQRLRERNYGEFEGINKTSFDYNDFWAYKKNLTYTKAENVKEFFERVYEFLYEIQLKYPDKNILVVAHAGVLKAIECYYNGMMDDEEIGPFLPDNASALIYDLNNTKIFNKLVRDNIPDIINLEGFKSITRILSDNEYKYELEKKLYEEYKEVLATTSTEERIEELADMLEIISYLAKIEGKTLDDVLEKSKEKKLKKGGFENKVYLERKIKQ